MYVVCYEERLRDGREDGAKVVDSLEAALAFLNKDFFAKANMHFRLFELGKEIPLTTETIAEPQPAKEKVVFKLLKDGGAPWRETKNDPGSPS